MTGLALSLFLALVLGFVARAAAYERTNVALKNWAASPSTAMRVYDDLA